MKAQLAAEAGRHPPGGDRICICVSIQAAGPENKAVPGETSVCLAVPDWYRTEKTEDCGASGELVLGKFRRTGEPDTPARRQIRDDIK